MRKMGWHGRFSVLAMAHTKNTIATDILSQTSPVRHLTEICGSRTDLLSGRLEQTETGGGILADEMGMGKSLSILALILRTLDAAHTWKTQLDTAASETMIGSARRRQRSRGTLIVASSDRAYLATRLLEFVTNHP